MATYVQMGESIEASSVQITARTKPPFPTHQSLNGKKYFLYRCKKRSEALIIRELDPKKYVICETSGLNKNDRVDCEHLDFYVEKVTTFQKASNYSATHGIQWALTQSFTYAKVAMPFRIFAEREHKAQILESSPKELKK